jgi:osmotically-inducible protein OsmY
MSERDHDGRQPRRYADWRDESPRAGRDPWADRDHEGRSFAPQDRPVFGERETGAGYDGPRGGGRPRSPAWDRDYRDAARVYGEASDGRGRSGGYDPTYRREPFEQASYELGSWFGDHLSERHREADISHRGLGPEGYRRSDTRINEDVHDHLTADPRVDARFIQVTVADGEVTLTGRVRDRNSKHRAEHCVEDIAGVTHVQNNLRVDHDLPKPAAPLGENNVLARQARGDD